MFGVKKKVERVRVALIQALRVKSARIMQVHASKPPEAIPKHDLARSMALLDLAEILESLRLEDHPDDDKT